MTQSQRSTEHEKGYGKKSGGCFRFLRIVISVVSIILLMGVVPGCVTRRAILLYSIQIGGTVVDSRTGEPIDGACVVFYHDFAYPRNGVEIGRSSGGELEVAYSSSMGMKQRKMIWNDFKGLQGSFIIELNRAGYQAFSHEFEFDSSKYGSPQIIDLGCVRLEPEEIRQDDGTGVPGNDGLTDCATEGPKW